MLEVLLALRAGGRLKRKTVNFSGKRGRIIAIVITLLVLTLLIITVIKDTTIA